MQITRLFLLLYNLSQVPLASVVLKFVVFRQGLSQQFSIDSKIPLSNPLVPQGSTLGPFLFKPYNLNWALSATAPRYFFDDNSDREYQTKIL